MRKSNLYLIIFLLIILYSWISKAADANKIPTVLIIAPKTKKITDDEVNSYVTYAKSNLPNHKVILITGYEEDSGDIYGHKIHAEIKEKIQENNLITHMYIIFHGYSSFKKSTVNDSYEFYTVFTSKLGRIYEDDVDEQFKYIFNPIRNQFATDAIIALNICNGFLFSDESVINRSKAIANYFNIHEGKIYGTITRDFGGISSVAHSFNPKLIITSLVGASIVMLLPAYLNNYNYFEYFNQLLIAASVIIPSSASFKYISNYLMERKVTGKIVNISADRAFEVEVLSKPKAFSKLISNQNRCYNLYYN